MKKISKTKLFFKARRIQPSLSDIFYDKEEWLALFCAALLFPFVTKLVQFYLDKSVLFHEFIINSNQTKIFVLVSLIVIFESLLFLFFCKFFNELHTNNISAAIYQGLKQIQVGIMFTSVIFLLDFLVKSFSVGW